MTTPNMPTQSRKHLSLAQKFEFFAFLKKHRDALSNPTPETYRTFDEWARLASLELNIPIHPTTLPNYARAAGIPLNPSLRRSVANTVNAPKRPSPTTIGLTPMPKYAALCDHVNRLEARITFLESQLGVATTAAH